LGRKHLRMVCLDHERLVAGLLSTEPEKVADGGAAVRAAKPLAACTPLELGRLRSFFQCLARAEKRGHVDAVVHLGECRDARVHCLCLLCCVSVGDVESKLPLCTALKTQCAFLEKGSALCAVAALRIGRRSPEHGLAGGLQLPLNLSGDFLEISCRFP